MSKKPPQEAAAQESFEQRLDQLEAVVRRLESPDLPLEQALQLFEEGMGLSAACRKELDEAETRVEILLKKGQSVQPAPFETDNE